MSETASSVDSFSPETVTARLQKGGALISDMRAIVSVWREGLEAVFYRRPLW